FSCSPKTPAPWSSNDFASIRSMSLRTILSLAALIALGLHFLHNGKYDVPLIPVTNRIGNVHHQDIHPGVSEHGHIFADDIFILSQLSKLIRFHLAEVPVKEGVVQGVNCINLRADEAVALAVRRPLAPY
ncbi:MAG: hypothetical protein ACWGO1_14485, partial [Anaerolineales bacterium]